MIVEIIIEAESIYKCPRVILVKQAENGIPEVQKFIKRTIKTLLTHDKVRSCKISVEITK